jgi:hypothetical protein
MRVISVISWVMLAIWGFLSLGGANAGTCRNYSEGSDTVQSCDNGHGSAWPPAAEIHGRHVLAGVIISAQPGSEHRSLLWIGFQVILAGHSGHFEDNLGFRGHSATPAIIVAANTATLRISSFP